MPSEAKTLTFDQLQQAVQKAAAIRLRVKLQPAGDSGGKVFPPTYAGGIYALEKRNVDGKEANVVLLDSVQSQANRLEQALLEAYRAGRIKFPLLAVDFSKEFPDIGEITALDAPHRIADAIFRDSILNGKPFRPQLKAGGARDNSAISEEGKRFAEANIRNATPLFELCPTALFFGVWDSTGAAGGLGNKFARALVSEIIGIDAVVGVRTSSRLDPLAIEKGEIYEGKNGEWVVKPEEAKKDKDALILFKRKTADKGKPSEINHGNVTPDIVGHESDKDPTTKKPLPIGGGVTISNAEQTTVLSLAALRRLKFPFQNKQSQETDAAARVVLAALALAAIAHQMDPPDYFLRSNCQLVLESEPVFQLVTTTQQVIDFKLSASQADEMFGEAVKAAKRHGLPWREEKMILQPKQSLVDLVKRSRELGGETEG